MFKRKVFPPSFLKNMHYQGKGCYGKEKVKDVAVLMDIEPSGTRREEISQKTSPTAKSIKKTHVRPVWITRDNHLP